MAASGRARWPTLLAAIVIFELALYRLWPLIDDNDPPPTIEQQLAMAAAVVLLTLPHSLAWLGRSRRWLLSVAGSLGIVLTVVSVLGFSLIFFTIPLVLVPSIVYLMRGSGDGSRAGTAGLTAAVIALAIGASAAFFLTEDPRCSITVRRDGKLVQETPSPCDPYNSGRLGPEVVEWSGTSDAIAWHESLLSLGLSGLALALCVRSGSATGPPTRATAAGAVS